MNTIGWLAIIAGVAVLSATLRGRAANLPQDLSDAFLALARGDATAVSEVFTRKGEVVGEAVADATTGVGVNLGAAVGEAGKATGDTAALVAFGRDLQKRGYTVTEHPAFGKVGKHAANSKHYSGRAIDVNHGSGTSKAEQAALAKLVPEAHKLGFRTIFMDPKLGHYDHLHVEVN